MEPRTQCKIYLRKTGSGLKGASQRDYNGAQDMLEAGIHENLLYHAAKFFLSSSSVE